jgi:protein-ribulosamine 3-kinase
MPAETFYAKFSGPQSVNTAYPTILDELGRGRPVELTSVAGGCIANARVASFSDGSSVFVKSAAGTRGMFEREAEGLRALATAGPIRVPEVLAVGGDALVLELIREATKKDKFFESFGRDFANLHDHRGPAFGFPHDNFIGSTPQRNDPIDGPWGAAAEDGSTWPEFFLERRLRFQVKLAVSKGHGHDIEHLLDRAEGQMAELLGSSIEPPSILHGDLWSGNYMVDDLGEACLIDPAVYYGHREADLAMTRLFGGFDSSFYEAYCEVSPLAPGHQERLPIYQLYHILNHLNLFGGSYYAQCIRILQRYAG